ncbi:MAG TPA: hypothetical protein VJZ71_06230 [Phycisphaerae bacterium]|nr:hypothetical protein [Phycisphaerae bacterium]
MKRMNWIALFITGVIGPTGLLFGQGTVFTYQGQLKDVGSPANGPYDMIFRVFDADMAGTQSGVDYPLAAVPVADGLFTVNLDFGPAIFTGAPLWLEIEVNTVVLAPRQAITGTPYAQKAASAQACNVADYASAPWVTSGADLYYNDGNVGIGTATPTAKLEVVGTPGVDGIKFPDGTLQTSATTGAAGFWSASAANIFSNNAGTVGVGTGTPDAKLHVAGGPVWTSNGWTKSLAVNNAAAIELGYGSATRFGIGSSSNGLYFFRTATEAVADAAHYFMSADSAGRIAMGDIVGSLTAKLEIFATGDGAELLRLNTERPWVFKQAYTGSGAALRLQNVGGGSKNFEITSIGGTNVATFWTNDTDPRVGIGTTAPQAMLDVNGTTRIKVLQITGADLAEKFPTTGEKVAPGTVMEIDPEHSGLLRTARGAYNQRVAGVVSGANDFPAGAILGHLPGNDDAPPIALSGRVWTYCDASGAPIAPGDLLTTSATPGHAMKALDRERSHGAVIGKAMSGLARGERGLVLVLVNLQ